MASRKEVWTRGQWANFTEDCSDTRDAIEHYIGDFPPTLGLKSSMLNHLVKAYTCMVNAMMSLETPLENQHPDIGDVVGYIHGPQGTQLMGNVTGKTRRDFPVLDRARWIDLGNDLKDIEADINSIILASSRILRTTNYAKFEKVASAIKKAKNDFDNVVCSQHPGWHEATHVFYGDPMKAEMVVLS